MDCEFCGTPYHVEFDPYGTGDSNYVIYEQQCDCEGLDDQATE